MKKISFCIALLLAFSANAQKMPSDTLDLEELVFVGFSKEKKSKPDRIGVPGQYERGPW